MVLVVENLRAAKQLDIVLGDLADGLVATNCFPYEWAVWESVSPRIWPGTLDTDAGVSISFWRQKNVVNAVRVIKERDVIYYVPPAMQRMCALRYWARLLAESIKVKTTADPVEIMQQSAAVAAKKVLSDSSPDAEWLRAWMTVRGLKKLVAAKKG